MNKETERKLAASLTSQSIEILPFIPYFLQDFLNWVVVRRYYLFN